MRDVELLVRFIAMQRYLERYSGRMKTFLDECCRILNEQWNQLRKDVGRNVQNFNSGVDVLLTILGQDLARKENSRTFNRAIFDALIYYAAKPAIQTAAMQEHSEAVADAYRQTVRSPEFLEAVESDTAGIPHTASRLPLRGAALGGALATHCQIPRVEREPDSGVRRSARRLSMTCYVAPFETRSNGELTY